MFVSNVVQRQSSRVVAEIVEPEVDDPKTAVEVQKQEEVPDIGKNTDLLQEGLDDFVGSKSEARITRWINK